MSDNGYADDFDDYDEDFESDELEVPPQPSLPSANGSTSIAGVAASAWPSLPANVGPLRGGQQKAQAAAAFTRSLFGGAPASHQQQQANATSVAVSPAPPPLTDSQRTRASKALRRSLQLQQQKKLSLTPELQLLALQPLSQYQQFAQGVGAFAQVRVGTCQTQQLGQDLHEQDAQTEEVEMNSSSCQVPDDNFVSTIGLSPFSITTSHDSNNSSSATAAKAAAAAKSAAAARMLEQDAALTDFLDWAVPEMVFELGRAAAAAEAAAEGTRAAAARQGLQFAPCNIKQSSLSRTSSITGKPPAVASSSTALFVGEMQLQYSGLLSGRTVVSVACPPTAADAAAASAAISAACPAAAASVSSHLLLTCYSPVAMSADALLKEHGIRGMGCLCMWDLKGQAQQQQQGVVCSGSLVQLLVTEGRPSCCCWGTGAGSSLVFAGMEEGGICCWDLSEPDTAHQQWQQQQPTTHKAEQSQPQQLPQQPARRPSYSTELPLLLSSHNTQSATHINSSISSSLLPASIVAVAVVPPTSSRTGSSSTSNLGGTVCQLVSLTSTGTVAMHSVMLGATAAGDMGAAAAAADLGTRAGSHVWLVNTFDSLPLGHIAAKPLHLRTSPTTAAAALSKHTSSSSSCSKNNAGCMQAYALALLPGVSQQVLVGSSRGRVLTGACLGTPPPPREYVAADWQQPQCLTGAQTYAGNLKPDTASLPDIDCNNSSNSGVVGGVVSLSVCPCCPEAWLAGHSCGSVALYSMHRSRPVLLWQQLRGAAVIAVRWLPLRPCQFVVLFADGCLLAFHLQRNIRQPIASLQLDRSAVGSTTAATAALPSCMEVVVSTASSTAALHTIDKPSSNRELRSRSSSNKTLRTTASSATAAATRCLAAVGYDDGSTVVYQLSQDWDAVPGQQQQPGSEDAMHHLQQLLASYH